MRLLNRRLPRLNVDCRIPALRCPEFDLLLSCARTRLDPDTADRIAKLLETPIDWPRTLGFARRHGLRPLLYWHLASRFAGLVPRQVLADLHQHFLLNRARNLSLSAELVRILVRLEDAGIPVLALKGPALAEFVYGNIAYREFDDLDILVPEGKLDEAAGILCSLGYGATQAVPRSRLASFRKTQYEIPFRHARTAACVELHWKAAPYLFPCALHMEDVWKRCQWKEFSGRKIRMLDTEDSLLFLCSHGGRHNWEKLEWICCVAEIIRENPHLNWERILGQSRATYSSRVLAFALVMARDLLCVSIPAVAAMEAARHHVLEGLSAAARAALFSARPLPDSAATHTYRQARLMDRRRDRILMLARALFLPKYHDWTAFRLPSGFGFLYYPLRLVRLALKSLVPSAWRRAAEARAISPDNRSGSAPGAPAHPGWTS